MKTLAVFTYNYSNDVRIFFESGWLEISYKTQWFLPHEYYTHPKNINDLIKYHREVANWTEIEL